MAGVKPLARKFVVSQAKARLAWSRGLRPNGSLQTPPIATDVVISVPAPLALLTRMKAPHLSPICCEALSEMPFECVGAASTAGCS